MDGGAEPVPHAGWARGAGRTIGRPAATPAIDPLAAEIGARLRRERLRAGLSQAELARRAGVVRSTVGRWEQGERLPSIPALLRLAGALGIGAERLLPPGEGAP